MNKTEILQKYPFRIELHAHTSPASPCGDLLPKEVIKTYKEQGVDAVVITNHFFSSIMPKDKKQAVDAYYQDYLDAFKAGKELGVTVYLGAELRFDKVNTNDYLLFGANKQTLLSAFDFLDSTLEDFRSNLSLPDSVLIQAHPFRNNCIAVSSELVDGFEAINSHPGHNNRNCFTIEHSLNKIKTCGSDFHHPGRNHEAMALLRTKFIPKDSFELASLLRSGDYVFEIGKNSVVIP